MVRPVVVDRVDSWGLVCGWGWDWGLASGFGGSRRTGRQSKFIHIQELEMFQ